MGELAADQFIAENVAINVHSRALLNAAADVVPAHAIHSLQGVGRKAIVAGLAACFNKMVGLASTHMPTPRLVLG